MKSGLFISLVFLFSVNLNAQLEKSLWINIQNENSSFIKFEYELLSYGTTGVENSSNYLRYYTEEDTLYVNALSSDKNCNYSEQKVGKYLFTMENNTLSLQRIKDECAIRYDLLNNKKWTFQEINVTEKLNYLVISIVKDKIVVEGIRNPQMLYITDVYGKTLRTVNDENSIELTSLDKGEYILQVWDKNKLQWEKKFDRE
jgi:hypothetical protein